MGSYKYTKYANDIPVVEKYNGSTFVSIIDTKIYEEDIRKFNYFVLDPDTDDTINTSYILRVYKNIKNYQVFTCAAGGHGGLIYGSGGNGGQYLYIDNIDDNSGNTTKQITRGSYLIKPGRSTNIFNTPNFENSINGSLNKTTGSFYLITYDNNEFRNFKSLQTIDNYKKKDWSSISTTTGDIKLITSTISFDQNKVYEFIFYLNKNTSFKFTNFQNLYYTRIIKVSNKNNINSLFTPDTYNAYTYRAGSYDEIITIILYKNSNEVLQPAQIPTLSSIIDVSYASTNSSNYYIYNFMTNKQGINAIIDTINGIDNLNNNNKNTSITYNENPDADYTTLETNTNTNSLQSGPNGNISVISANPAVNINYMLKNFYMPALFAGTINLSGGSAGTSLDSVRNNCSGLINTKLGGCRSNKILATMTGKRIVKNTNTNEWYSGVKGYFSNYFKLFAKYPYDENIEMNNTSLANGGFTGYWQFIKDEINYNYGANGINNLSSPNYGVYGCGGQGGSVLFDPNSTFTGSRGKNGVFVLSFLNQALATISNDNSIVLKKMFGLFGIKSSPTLSEDKLAYINYLTEDNSDISGSINFKGMINNLFIHQANIHIDQTYITQLNTYIPKANFNNLLAVIYIIQRIYYVISLNLTLINISKITKLNISFVGTKELEKVEWLNNSEILFIKICDIIDNDYIKKYINSSSITTYRDLLISGSFDNIIILKENGVISEYGNPSTPINTSYNSDSNSNDYKFIVNTVSYIFNIQAKDFKIHINAIETAFDILCKNAIIYAIIYHTTTPALVYTETIIENIYTRLSKFNNELKRTTDRIAEYKNIFQEQNEFKLYFNNSINDYNNYRDKNTSFHNLLTSKKAYTATKEKFRNTVNIFTIIIFIIIIILILWLIYVIIFNSNKYDAMPHLIFMFLILIIVVFILNYLNYSYGYKEFFVNPNENASQLEILDNEKYKVNNITFNNKDYTVTYITENSTFMLNNNIDTSIVLINNGSEANLASKEGQGGTINIYDPGFVASAIKEKEEYKVEFNPTSTPNQISIIKNNLNQQSTGIITSNRDSYDPYKKIKIYYNNNDSNYSSNYSTLLDYYNNILNIDNPYNSNTLTSSYMYLNYNEAVLNAYYDNSITTSYTCNISSDNIINSNMSEIVNVLFNKDNLSAYYYGSSGCNLDAYSCNINKVNYSDAYGLGGAYETVTTTGISNTGINGACIIINKQVEFLPTHMDVQTLINMYNNNLNKYIYDRFNKIYLIDNNVIYNNALVSFRKRYDEENVKNNKYKKYETNLNQYSTNILMDVYFRYEIAKILTYIFLALIICIIIYRFNNEHFILLVGIYILMVIFIVMYFFYNMNINTRRDYYKYYWSKYNNDN